MTDEGLKEEAKRIYQSAKEMSAEDFRAKNEGVEATHSDLCHRVANGSSEEEFIQFVESGETSVALTDGEMEVLSGGRLRRKGNGKHGKPEVGLTINLYNKTSN